MPLSTLRPGQLLGTVLGQPWAPFPSEVQHLLSVRHERQAKTKKAVWQKAGGFWGETNLGSKRSFASH